MLIGYKRGQGSIVLRVKILDSSVSTGAGKTGLTFSSTGLIISTIADNEASATAYTVAGSTIETVTTLGTFSAPTASKCRFREVDATNHKGVYEIQIADARFSVSNAKSLLISISGASNAADCDVVIPLRDLDPYDPTRAGLTGLPNANAGAVGGLPLSVDTSGRVDVLKVNGTSQTARDLGGQLDAAITTRLASASYTAPDNAGISSASSSAASAASSASTAATNTTTILARLGSFTASGVNTVLGFLQAIMSKAATLPSDVGGTYSPTTDSLEAQQDNGGTLTTAGANAVADAMLDRTDGVETGETPRQSLRLVRAATVGKCDGASGTTMHFRDKADSKNRITATVDADGNRTAVTTDAT